MSSPALSRHRASPTARRTRARPRRPADHRGRPATRSAGRVPLRPAAPAPGGGRRRCSPSTGCRPASAQPGHRGLLRYQHAEDRGRAPGRPHRGLHQRAVPSRWRPGSSGRTAQQRDVVLVGEPGGRRRTAAWRRRGHVPSTSPTAARPARPAERAQALEAEVGQLRAAMASRAAIEQAKGILMLLTSCGEQVGLRPAGAHLQPHPPEGPRRRRSRSPSRRPAARRCPTTSARSSGTPARRPSPLG